MEVILQFIYYCLLNAFLIVNFLLSVGQHKFLPERPEGAACRRGGKRLRAGPERRPPEGHPRPLLRPFATQAGRQAAGAGPSAAEPTRRHDAEQVGSQSCTPLLLFGLRAREVLRTMKSARVAHHRR